MVDDDAWRPTRWLSRPALWTLLALLLLATPAAHLLDLALRVEVGTPSTVVGWSRAANLTAFLLLLLVWVWNARSRRRLVTVALAGVLWAATSQTTLLLLGVEVQAGGRLVAAGLLQAGVTLAFYRWRVGDDNLTPHRPNDVAALLAAAVVGALLSAPLSPHGRPPTDLLPAQWPIDLGLLVWVVLAGAWVFVGAACLTLLVQRRPRSEALPTRAADVYLLALAIGLAVGVENLFPEAPLSWAVLLPAVSVGLATGPWTSAALALGTTLLVLALGLREEAVLAYGAAGDPLTDQAVVRVLLLHALMVAFVLVALLLSLVRDQRAHLTREVRQRRQEALDQAGVMETLLESLDDALLLLDRQGGVRLHNRAARRLLGPQLETEAAKWLRRETTSARFSYSVHDPDHATRVVTVQLAPVQYAGSEGVMALARDVTSEHRRIEELASFAAVAAHDLKGPLTALEGWLEVAGDVVESDTPRARAALEHAWTAAHRMSTEIDDWLAYNVAREGQLSPEPVALTPELRDLAHAHPRAMFDFQTHDVVVADRTLLRHLLANLLGNAVKYTLPGEIPRVQVRSVREDRWVRIEVTDSGVGIPEGEETAVFEPFRRASTVSDHVDGSGLGLALCKQIVRRHGGTIAAAPNAGVGTTITFSLPAHPGARSALA